MSDVRREALAARDAADPLAHLRSQFALPEDLIYLDGNSLGPLPHSVAARLRSVVEQEWGEGLIGSWNDAHWIDLPTMVAGNLAPLLGTTPQAVTVGDSTSVNLYKLLGAACRLRPDRSVIVTEADNFPTDQYIADALPGELRRVPGDAIAAAIDEHVAVVLLSHVNYRSGAMHDLREITALAHAQGALVIWDLAHSAGVVPLSLDDDGADFAVGCGYKFLNGGPGAPAFAYVHRRHHDALQSPIQGWFGHARPFAFEPTFEPAPGVSRLQVGTPPILSLAALDEALKLAHQAPIEQIRQKSIALFDVFCELMEPIASAHGFDIITPRDARRRGSQISLRHDAAWPICRALINEGVIGDFREPDILRFGLTPLYTRYVDLFDAVETLQSIMDDEQWRRPEFNRRTKVT